MNDSKLVIKRPNKNFTAVPNELLLDGSITAKAKGIFCYIASRPEGWVFYMRDITNHMKDGIDSVRGALIELEKSGWLIRRQLKDGAGKFCGSEIEFFNQSIHTRAGYGVNSMNAGLEESPLYEQELPHREKPHTGEPHAEKPTYNNTDQSNTDINKKKNIKKKSAKITLAEWEEKNGELDTKHLTDWGKKNKLDATRVHRAIQDFRDRVVAGGYLYADYAAAFRTWHKDKFDELREQSTKPVRML